MKIEIDTNKDSYPDCRQTQKFIKEIYQTRIKNRDRPVIISPDFQSNLMLKKRMKEEVRVE